MVIEDQPAARAETLSNVCISPRQSVYRDGEYNVCGSARGKIAEFHPISS